VSATITPTLASTTPILDRLAPLPKMASPGRARVIALGIWFGLVFVSTLTFTLWQPPFLQAVGKWLGEVVPHGWNLANFFLLALQWLTMSYVAITIHELGHAIVGVCVGFHLNSVRVGLLQFDRPFRISRYRGRGTGAGGWASLFPDKQDRLILRTIVMLLAGPAANLVSACFIFLLPYSKGPGSWCFLLASLLMGILNLFPFRSRAVISDGGRIFMLLRNRARGERWLATLRLLGEMRSGVPYERLSPEFLAKAVAIEDRSPDTVVAYALAYAAAFWGRKDDDAAHALEVCLRNSALAAPSARHALMSDAAVFQARRRKRVDLAELWQSDIPQKSEYPWHRPRAEAAILEAKGDISGALKKLHDIEKMILATPNEALREISLRGLRRWRAEVQPQAEAAGVSSSQALI
jgi:hypothetical protein